MHYNSAYVYKNRFMTARLPVPGQDHGAWAHLLNNYLLVEHNADGTLKKTPSIDSAVQLGGDLAGTPKAPVVPALSTKVAKDELAINVKDYGAAGDGSTNDTAAIQSAIDAAYAAGGGEVFAPAATYIVSPNPGLQVKGNVTFRGAGKATIFKIANSTNTTGNLIRSEAWSDVVLRDFSIDGNRAGQTSSTNYGVYVAGSANSKVERVWVRNMTGVGIHIYNSDGIMVSDCESQGNVYHGFEAEQARGCIFRSNRGTANDLHGLLISPGERSGSGSVGNSFVGNTFDTNGQYGIASNAANGDISAWLNKGNVISGNQIYGNQQYGIQMYKQDNTIISGNFIYNNKFFGLYLYQSQNNIVHQNILLNNSQAGNGAYDEILLEGAQDNPGHPSKNNDVSHNTILISSGVKARWAVREATANDGPNIITYNNIPAAGTSGMVNRQAATSIVSDPAGVTQVYGLQAIQGASAGLDNAFNNVLRLYNNFAGGETQIVTPNGPATFYVGGPKRMEINPDGHIRMTAPAAAPVLVDNGTISFYLDEANNGLKVAVKYSNGTTKTGTVVLS